MVRTLADRVADLDRARFRGRSAELRALEPALDDRDGPRVVHLHGPGGMGKSALVRELGRRAADRGLRVRTVDGRDVAPVPGEIERAVDVPTLGDRALLVLDSYERTCGADGWLRSTLLPSLPEGVVTVLAGRRPPTPAWFRDGWEHVCLSVELGPLGPSEAGALLAAADVDDPDESARLLRWCRGWPLALTLAAGTGLDHSGGPDLLRSVVARLVDDRHDADLLMLAAVVRSCDPRIVSAVLPGADPVEAIDRLRQLAFAEPVGSGVALHDLVRRGLRAELRERRPDEVAALRRRVVDDLHARAVAGEPRLLIDLTDLIDDPALRWGLGAHGNVDYRIAAVGPGDREALAAVYARRPQWWADLARYLDEAPERVVVARDATDALAGVSVAVTGTAPPRAAAADSVLGAWLAHARRHHGDAEVLLWRDATDFGRRGEAGSPVTSLMNTATILGCGLTNPRWSYIPVDPLNPAARAFSRSVGGRPVASLRREVDGHPLECHVIDHGPGGMLGQLRDVVYAELGVVGGTPAGAPHGTVTVDVVREALRGLHRPDVLAGSPLAAGVEPHERAAWVRARVEQAVDRAFGQGSDEQLLREVLRRGYLEPDRLHEQVAHELHLSRTAYFRRLRQATARLVPWLADDVDPSLMRDGSP